MPVRASGVGTPRAVGLARGNGGGPGWWAAVRRLAGEHGAEAVAVVLADARAARLLEPRAAGTRAARAWGAAGEVAVAFDAGVAGAVLVRPGPHARLAALGARAGEVVAGAAEAAADAEAVRELRAARRDARSLGDALRTAARELATPECLVDVRGAGPCGGEAEALLLVARVAVASAVRRGRARVVTVAVGASSVVVRDDGAAWPARPGGDAFRLRLAARPLAAGGGGLEISHGRRPGAVVRAWTGSGPG
ncbi:MAG TPA: hypothetical protein VGX28_12090 [Frankiaceae bacterium]|nr:hypothetical protein [Frankiaceae bacterium]